MDIWTILKLILYSTVLTVSLIYFQEFRKTGTWIDVWHDILQIDFLLIAIMDYCEKRMQQNNNNNLRRIMLMNKVKLFIYLFTLFYGSVTFWFDNSKLIHFEVTEAPKLLINLILFEVLALRYIFYIASFGAVIGVFASAFGCLVACLKQEDTKIIDLIYDYYLNNKAFNLPMCYKDNKALIDDAPFSEKELAVLKDSCSMLFEAETCKFETCVICFSEFEEKEEVVGLPVCGHIYHYECLNPWLKQKNKCAICKGAVRYNLMMKIHLKARGMIKHIPADSILGALDSENQSIFNYKEEKENSLDLTTGDEESIMEGGQTTISDTEGNRTLTTSDLTYNGGLTDKLL